MSGSAPGSVARRCVTSLATGDGSFGASLHRLGASLERAGFAGDFLAWEPGRLPPGCPEHLDVPFAFKPYCLHEARLLGYGAVLWLDAACVAVRPLEPLFERLEREGTLLFANRALRVGEWASDLTLARLGVTRTEALELPEVNGAALGLDLRTEVGRDFLDAWLAAAREGDAFRGVDRPLGTRERYQRVKHNTGGCVSRDPRVRGHRHDQSVAGILAARLGIELLSEGLASYGGPHRFIAPSTVVVVDRTLPRAGGRLRSLRSISRSRALSAAYARARRRA